MNQQIFREYDIRGLVGTDLTEETVKILARAIGTYFKRHNVKRFSLGYDARESSPVLCGLFLEAFARTGLDVLNVGMIPIPLLYYTLFTEEVEAGVMITGSHNPAEFNGFIEILSNSEKTLSEFLSDLPKVFNTPEIKIDCDDKQKFEIVRRLSE